MKEYKGKKVSYKNFIEEDVIGQTKFIYEYEGYCSADEYDEKNLYHGNGKLIERRINIKTNKMVDYRDGDWIREGEFDNGEFIKGTYLTPFTTKYEGVFRTSDSDNDSQLNGEGIEYHFISKQNYLKDKSSGYVKGFFDDGTLIKGEVLNPSLIKYSEEKGIKKIVLTGKIRRVYDEKIKSYLDLNQGKIYYEVLPNIDSNRPEGQGVEYEGEIDYDQPHGKGTMTFEDGSKRFAIWSQGETDWD